MEKSRFQRARRALIFWTLFIGIGAVGGAAMMLIDPSGRAMGMDAMLPYFQVLPFAEVVFQDFNFSGWALLIVNGLTNLTAAGLLLAKEAGGRSAGRRIRRDADAVDMHSVLHVPAELHVHELLRVRPRSGGDGLGGVGVPAAGGVFREPGNERKMLWISINSQKSAASGCLF